MRASYRQLSMCHRILDQIEFSTGPNTVQRTRQSHHCCNPRLPQAGSLSLGRSTTHSRLQNILIPMLDETVKRVTAVAVSYRGGGRQR